MHFNVEIPKYGGDSSQRSKMQPNSENVHDVGIDTLMIDDHYRFTWSKKLRKVFPVEIGDTVSIYQTQANSLILEIQRGMSIVDRWMLLRQNTLVTSYLEVLVKALSKRLQTSEYQLSYDNTIANDDIVSNQTNCSKAYSVSNNVNTDYHSVASLYEQGDDSRSTFGRTGANQVLRESIEQIRTCERSLNCIECSEKDFTIECTRYVQYKLRNVIQELEANLSHREGEGKCGDL